MNISLRGPIVAVLVLLSSVSSTNANAANTIQVENAKPGNPDWELSNYASNHEIEGYASLTSVNRGGQIQFFVNTIDPSYTIDIYRTGWYGGAGARLITSITNLTGIAQPACPTVDSATGLIECAWTNPYTLQVPNDTADSSDWASGVYLARLTGSSGLQSFIVFVVRDDARAANYLFQCSSNTYQAYNNWGGRSLYAYNSDFQARKVSFNRPYVDSQGAGQYVGSYEYPAVRFLEREGYDVTYATDLDVHENANVLVNKKADLIVGHGEYWSWEMRTNVTAARDKGINLAFWGANNCYWQVRFEPSTAGGVADRTMVGYKDFALTEDPDYTGGDPSLYHLVTTNWRADPVNLPEDALIGVLYANVVQNGDIVVVDPSNWVFNSTGLQNGSHLTGLLGVEVDTLGSNTPAGTLDLAHSPYDEQGTTLYSDMTVYTAASGATVFAAGSIYWPEGLDGFNGGPMNAAAQQMTRNQLAQFIGDQPPVANPGGPYTGTVGQNVQFDGSGSTTANGTVTTYQWDFGDGSTGTGVKTTHTYNTAETFTVTLIVTNSQGSRNAATTTATISTSSGGGGGSLALVQQGTVTVNAAASVVVNLGAAPRSGDALVLFSVSDNVNITGVSGGGVTWVRGTVGGTHTIIEIWYGVNSTGSGAVITVSYTDASGSGGVNVSEFSGVATTNALDVAPGESNGISATPTTPTATTSNANDLIVAAAAMTDTGATTGGPTNSFTALNEAASANKIVPAYRIVTATGSYSTSWTENNDGWDAVIVALKAGSGTTPPPVALSSVSVSPSSVTGGSGSTGTVTLSGAAPSGGASVTLTSSNTSAAQVPGSVTVSSGATSVTFAVTTSSVTSATSVTITGSYSGGSKTTTLTVNPSGGGSGSIAFVQQATATVSSAASVVVNLGAAPRSGDALALFSVNDNVNITGVSGGGVTWVRAAVGGTHTLVEIWYGLNSTGSGATITVSYTDASGSGGVNVSEFSGVATTNALDVAPGESNGISATPTTPTATTSNGNDLLLAAAAMTDTGATTGGPTNSFTALNEAASANKIVPAYRIVTATGSYSTSWTETNDGWDAVIVALKSK